MSEIDISTWNPDPDLNKSIGDIPLNESASIRQTWQAIQMLMAASGKNGLQLVPFAGATSQEDGKQGLVPAPEAGDQDKVLKGDGSWGALSASDIPNIDASKIVSGTIDLARLPAGALERLVTVADQTARYALTTADVQLGDVVKQLDTGVMYIVVDTSKLGQADGYVEFTAGAAASVPWSGVTGKPSSFTPSSHTHGSITNDGKLETASRVVVTDSDKLVDVSSVTSTELGHLSGVTSALQTQIDGKVSKSGDTMTGDLTISSTSPNLYLQNTLIERGTAPSSNKTITEILGKDYNNKSTWALYHTYTTDKTHRIRLLCYNGLTTDTQYAEIGVGYDSNGNPFTNAPTPAVSDDSTKIATTAWVRDATGNFACNAATATEFSANKSVTLTGAVTGEASSTGGWSVSTVWRSCIVGRNDLGTSNPWYKVASRKLSGASSAYNITFYVENANTASKSFGILRASVGTYSDRTINAGVTKFAWLVNDGFAEEDFVLVCPATAEPTVELWTKVAIGYLRKRFVVISEGGNTRTGILWTLFDASSAGQEASIPTEGTQVVSSASSLEQRVKALEEAMR